MAGASENRLGTYLKDRRAKLDPASLGLSLERRRTPRLRREEVAQRANVSATWYTWLEQGRGGAPSADVLDRIARALALTGVEREHLFLIALGHPPEVRDGLHDRVPDHVSPRLQRVLDAFEVSPAYVKTATWDIVAWNAAAAAVLTDYAALAPEQRNILRLVFTDSRVRVAPSHWQNTARFVVAAFRADVARAGATARATAFVEELCRTSASFDAIWRAHDVRSTYGEAPKLVDHPTAGPIALEYSAFAIDGGLDLVVYNPATPADADRVRALLAEPPQR